MVLGVFTSYFCLTFIWGFERHARIVALIALLLVYVHRLLIFPGISGMELGWTEKMLAILFYTIKVVPFLVAACYLRKRIGSHEANGYGHVAHVGGKARWTVVLFWLLPVFMFGWDYILDIIDKFYWISPDEACDFWAPTWWSAIGGTMTQVFDVWMQYFLLALIWGFRQRAKLLAIVFFVLCFSYLSCWSVITYIRGNCGLGYVLYAAFYSALFYAPFFWAAYKLIEKWNGITQREE